MPIALAQQAFPALGQSYDVSWAQQDGRMADGKIKVIRKGDGPWIFVEYTFIQYLSPPQPAVSMQHTVSGAPRPPRPPGPNQEPQVSTTPVTKQLWINTHWILTASELDPEKK